MNAKKQELNLNLGTENQQPKQQQLTTVIGPFNYRDVTLKELSEKISRQELFALCYSFYIPSEEITNQNEKVVNRWVWCSSKNQYSCYSDLVAFLIHSSLLIPEQSEGNYLGVLVTVRFVKSNCSIFVMKRKNGIRSRYSSKLMGLSLIVKSTITLTTESQIPKVFWNLKQFDDYLKMDQTFKNTFRKRQYNELEATGPQETINAKEPNSRNILKTQKEQFQTCNFQTQKQEFTNNTCRYPKRTRKLKKLSLSNLVYGPRKKSSPSLDKKSKLFQKRKIKSKKIKLKFKNHKIGKKLNKNRHSQEKATTQQKSEIVVHQNDQNIFPLSKIQNQFLLDNNCNYLDSNLILNQYLFPKKTEKHDPKQKNYNLNQQTPSDPNQKISTTNFSFSNCLNNKKQSHFLKILKNDNNMKSNHIIRLFSFDNTPW
ncbi:hypothetical protein M0812_00610 [Anaeramoeba flamelloides]|uniref:Uncharacterized protein n=1 Tax=Anaeramoeba flamelloides TaxID=1746091 RepID=A0AAV8A7B0_9EUKA|nr:hypothetical protein M0812_00610 [Anaeramoeba flamelloides]